MDKQYNLYNTEALFKLYLTAEKMSPVSLKNYLSDIRHFFGWFTFKVKSQISNQSIDQIHIIGLINLPFVNDYKSYLIENNLPLRTVNRRLSTLRKFCSFCIKQGWLKENPAKKITNVIARSETTKQSQDEIATLPSVARNDILSQFKEELLKTKDIKQVNIIINDVEEFLSFPDININLSQPIIS